MRFPPERGRGLFILAYALAAVAFWLEMLGGGWDIEYHLAGQVERFWTPPHILLYGGIGVSFAASLNGLLLRHFGTDVPDRLRRGLEVSTFGGFIELSAGLFDSWWHATLGVDNAFSPPHLLMIVGMNVVGLGLVLGVATLSRDAGFWRAPRWRGRALVSLASPAAGTGWLFALLGLAWIFSHPGFGDDPILPQLEQRLLVAAVFSAVLAFVTVAMRTWMEARWTATSMMACFGASISAIEFLTGEGPGILLNLPFFILAGVLVDAAFVRRWHTTSLRFAIPLMGALVGVLGLVLLRLPSEDMTGGLAANPPGFVTAYALGGLVGAILGFVLSQRLRIGTTVGVERPAMQG